jgi:type II secretory pathway component PulC
MILISSALANELRDPMAPFTAASGSEAGPANNGFVLSAIIIGKQRRVAIINDEPYLVGYLIRDYRLTAIEPNSVELTRDGSSRRLMLNSTSMEKSDDPN